MDKEKADEKRVTKRVGRAIEYNGMGMRIASLTVTATLTAFVLNALGADSGELELEKRFAGIVHPFLEAHCFNCHGKEKPKAQLDLTPFSTMKAVVADYPRWELVLEKLAEKEMPPEEAKHQPSGESPGRDRLDSRLAQTRGRA